MSRQERDWLKVSSRWPDDAEGIEAIETRFGLTRSPGFPDYREDFERGNKRALLFVIKTCAECRWSIPQWAAVAFIDMYLRGIYAEIESWDDVFGKPWGYGQRRTAITASKTWSVFARVVELHNGGVAITNELFEIVGREFGISRPTVSTMYYAERQHFRDVFSRSGPKERELYGKGPSPKEKEIYGLD